MCANVSSLEFWSLLAQLGLWGAACHEALRCPMPGSATSSSPALGDTGSVFCTFGVDPGHWGARGHLKGSVMLMGAF